MLGVVELRVILNMGKKRIKKYRDLIKNMKNNNLVDGSSPFPSSDGSIQPRLLEFKIGEYFDKNGKPTKLFSDKPSMRLT